MCFKRSACKIVETLSQTSNVRIGVCLTFHFCYFPKLTIRQTNCLHTVSDHVSRCFLDFACTTEQMPLMRCCPKVVTTELEDVLVRSHFCPGFSNASKIPCKNEHDKQGNRKQIADSNTSSAESHDWLVHSPHVKKSFIHSQRSHFPWNITRSWDGKLEVEIFTHDPMQIMFLKPLSRMQSIREMLRRQDFHPALERDHSEQPYRTTRRTT